MGIGGYLPSTQFALMASALIVSGALVFAADKITSPANVSAELTAGGQPGPASDWKAALAQIQAESGITLPEPANPDVVAELLEEAQSSNLTSTVARSLLINLSDAKTQGLGDDIPTQEKLIAQAVAQAGVQNSEPTYATSDLQVVPQTTASLRTYGNNFMATLKSNTRAHAADTYMAMGYALDYGDKSKLAPLSAIGEAYESLAQTLAQMPVPATLAPLHLSVVNKFAEMSVTYEDMSIVLEDPLRGLGGLERFRLLQSETSRLLTNLAQELQRNGILFSTTEAGATWSVFLPQ